MPAKDLSHNAVKAALSKAGWTITHAPLKLGWGDRDLYVDTGAEWLSVAEKVGEQIVVEVKNFVGATEVDDPA